jgi:hypothetical protein
MLGMSLIQIIFVFFQAFFKFLKSHFEVNENEEKKKSFSLFRGIVQNGWLGITYVALERMERFGVSYAR